MVRDGMGCESPLSFPFDGTSNEKQKTRQRRKEKGGREEKEKAREEKYNAKDDGTFMGIYSRSILEESSKLRHVSQSKKWRCSQVTEYCV